LKKKGFNKEEHNQLGGISRREFLAGAGLVFGGAVAGAGITHALTYSNEKVKEVEPEILGMSCVISVGWDSLKETVEALKRAGLRDKVKIILGGGGVDEEVAKFAGADAAVKDAIQGIEQCRRWVSI